MAQLDKLGNRFVQRSEFADGEIGSRLNELTIALKLSRTVPSVLADGEVCKNSIDRKLRGLSIIVVQDAPQTLTATNDAFT